MVHKSVDFHHIQKLSNKEGPLALHRNGKIRELFNMSSLVDTSLETEMLNHQQHGSQKMKDLLNHQTIDPSTGLRYYVNSKRDYNTLADQCQELDRKKKDPLDVEFVDSPTASRRKLPEILPMMKHKTSGRAIFSHSIDHTDPRVNISKTSIT